MAEILVKDGFVATMGRQRTVYRRGSLRIQDDRIVEVGEGVKAGYGLLPRFGRTIRCAIWAQFGYTWSGGQLGRPELGQIHVAMPHSGGACTMRPSCEG